MQTGKAADPALLLAHALFLTGRQLNQLLDAGMSVGEILDRIRMVDFLGKGERLTALEADGFAARELEACRQQDIQLVSRWDDDYPALLKQIPDPPVILYRRGTYHREDENAVAVVGSRHPSLYGRDQALRMSHDLAASGLTIVSGLARGIDQQAHAGALTVSHGRTLAVLGCGLDRVYPKENQMLFDRLVERGAAWSEYPLGTPPLGRHFPQRNRIISGLSLGVLVVEAHRRSGSLITAREALEQGREVFAIPGPINQMTSWGTNGLIKDGAYLIEEASDILEVLGQSLASRPNLRDASPPPAAAAVIPDARTPAIEISTADLPEAWQPILASLKQGAQSTEELAFLHGQSVKAMAHFLVEMEIQGRIHRQIDGQWRFVRRDVDSNL